MNPLVAFVTAATEATAAVKGMAQQVRAFGGANIEAGFQAINRSFQLLGSVLGTVLTPLLVLFAAGVATAADFLLTKIQPALAGFIDGLIEATKAIFDFAETVGKKMLSAVQSFGDWIGEKLYGKIPEVGGGLKDTEQGKANAAATGQPVGQQEQGFDFRKSFVENLKGLAQEIRMGMAPSGYSGIADAAKRLQVQSFQSTLQQKILSLTEQTVRWLEKIAGGIQDIQPGLQ